MEQTLLKKSDNTSEQNMKVKDLPASQEMLYSVREELKTEINSLRIDVKEIDARVQSQFQQLQLQIQVMGDKIGDQVRILDSKLTTQMQKLDIKLSNQMQSLDDKLTTQMQALDIKLSNQMQSMEGKLTTKIHHQTLLFEEQNNKNNFVIDKYSVVAYKQDRHEERISNLEKSTFGIESK